LHSLHSFPTRRSSDLILSILRALALKLATPATAAFVKVPLRFPPPALLAIATVTVEVSVVTVLPPASCTVTTGCVVQAVPPVPRSQDHTSELQSPDHL